MTPSIRRDLRTRRFRRIFVKNLFAAGGVVAAALGLVDVFWPDAISKSELPIVPIAIMLSLTYAIFHSWPRPVQHTYKRPNTEIRIVEGDLFDRDTDLVIGVSTTFDTAIPRIISLQSVQGQLLTKVFGSDVNAFDTALSAALQTTKPSHSISKPGKTEAYPLGTIAVIDQHSRRFYCAAYTEMNEHNEAQASADGMWRCLESLWREVRATSNGQPVATPVLGGGQARIAHILPAQDSIRFIALSFILASRHARVSERLDIVVRKQDVAHLDMLELQAFLKSLDAS
jgi:hypothetical protein